MGIEWTNYQQENASSISVISQLIDVESSIILIYVYREVRTKGPR